MPLRYHIDSPNALVSITGEFTSSDEWVALCTAITQDPQFRSGLNFIRDLRGSMPPERVETIFEAHGVIQQFWDRLRVRRAALLADTTIAPLAYAVGIEHGLPDLRLRTFTRYDDAIRWLEENDCAPVIGGADR